MDINSVAMPHMPEELRHRYLSRRLKDIQDCATHLMNRDWAYFERLGHQLKGNAPSYGFHDLGPIANRIEKSALEKNLTELEKSLEEFKNWMLQHGQ